MLCFLNPGHDRELDSGAVNKNSGIRECDLAYELAVKVQELLAQKNIEAPIRQSDDLYSVCEAANDLEADMFVSIHFNAFNQRATGTETLISSTPASLILGHCIQSHLKAALVLPDRGLKERPGLYVLRNTVMPAVLVEVCFVDNDFDLARYLNRVDQAAAAIADGIAMYAAQLSQNVA